MKTKKGTLGNMPTYKEMQIKLAERMAIKGIDMGVLKVSLEDVPKFIDDNMPTHISAAEAVRDVPMIDEVKAYLSGERLTYEMKEAMLSKGISEACIEKLVLMPRCNGKRIFFDNAALSPEMREMLVSKGVCIKKPSRQRRRETIQEAVDYEIKRRERLPAMEKIAKSIVERAGGGKPSVTMEDVPEFSDDIKASDPKLLNNIEEIPLVNGDRVYFIDKTLGKKMAKYLKENDVIVRESSKLKRLFELRRLAMKGYMHGWECEEKKQVPQSKVPQNYVEATESENICDIAGAAAESKCRVITNQKMLQKTCGSKRCEGKKCDASSSFISDWEDEIPPFDDMYVVKKNSTDNKNTARRAALIWRK